MYMCMFNTQSWWTTCTVLNWDWLPSSFPTFSCIFPHSSLPWLVAPILVVHRSSPMSAVLQWSSLRTHSIQLQQHAAVQWILTLPSVLLMHRLVTFKVGAMIFHYLICCCVLEAKSMHTYMYMYTVWRIIFTGFNIVDDHYHFAMFIIADGHCHTHYALCDWTCFVDIFYTVSRLSTKIRSRENFPLCTMYMYMHI